MSRSIPSIPYRSCLELKYRNCHNIAIIFCTSVNHFPPWKWKYYLSTFKEGKIPHSYKICWFFKWFNTGFVTCIVFYIHDLLYLMTYWKITGWNPIISEANGIVTSLPGKGVKMPHSQRMIFPLPSGKTWLCTSLIRWFFEGCRAFFISMGFYIQYFYNIYWKIKL